MKEETLNKAIRLLEEILKSKVELVKKEKLTESFMSLSPTLDDELYPVVYTLNRWRELDLRGELGEDERQIIQKKVDTIKKIIEQ